MAVGMNSHQTILNLKNDAKGPVPDYPSGTAGGV